MGFKMKKRILTFKEKAGVIKGYIAEPGRDALEKGKNYSKKLNKKKLI